MFEKHEVVTEPDPAAIVWRYMDLSRYLSLLDAQALHFARADQMTDRWEGSFGPANLHRRPQVYSGDHYALLEPRRDALRQYTLTHTHMSCWHLSEVESAAMWDLYQRDGRGVAVRSTWERLTTSIRDDRSVYGGKIEYVDYDTTWISEQNALEPFLHKRRSFDHEKEVRLLCLTGLDGGPDPNDSNSRLDGGPEFEVVTVAVDLASMIESVHVAPGDPEWIHRVVESVTGKYGHSFPVKQSELDQDPIA